MGRPVEPPRRLEEAPAPPLRAVAKLIADAGPHDEPALDGFAVARIERRLREAPARAPRGRLLPATVALIATLSAGAVIASAAMATKRWPFGDRAPSTPTPPARAPTIRAGARAPVILQAAPPGDPAPLRTEPLSAAPRPVVRRPSPRLEPPPAALPAETPRSHEVELFSRAIALARAGLDPALAIDTCGEYLARYPQGAFADEVRAVRAELALRAGRRAHALADLERLPFGTHERALALRLLRAELRADGSCASALADFDRVLAAALPPDLLARALRGRSVCRARLGDDRGAAADAHRYLERFPDGEHAAELRGLTIRRGSP